MLPIVFSIDIVEILNQRWKDERGYGQDSKKVEKHYTSVLGVGIMSCVRDFFVN